AACRADRGDAFADKLATVVRDARDAGLTEDEIRRVFDQILESREPREEDL
ncbi:MAG: hypothetical protein HN380_31385, partial [Victivallales bacterium]|nr:hypothetical protein [Victivallales bacterium]